MKPFDPHGGVSYGLYPSLQVNPASLHLAGAGQGYDELRRRVGAILLGVGGTRFSALHVTQVNDLWPWLDSVNKHYVLHIVVLVETYLCHSVSHCMLCTSERSLHARTNIRFTVRLVFSFEFVQTFLFGMDIYVMDIETKNLLNIIFPPNKRGKKGLKKC